ncbi:hypothetical protein J41TS12_50340 [Paenibacillus antibioticophila]|uniref:Uncharacterized protein n=1 Tax=Paenibacillus antibioticophila TaxID=1274374 RepID=A0A919Y0U4_9BACL|nr:hypothetical protein [Paenibacillus antibioticophila]GIO40173.1 hypothetical protein J41TS12_50340 [Paenibacillus antibioticophila]
MPKVLIIRGRAGTWYEHSVANLHEFSHFADCVYIVKVGTSSVGLEVREEDGVLLYTESEYNEVVRQRDKMIDDLAKHAEELAQLKKDNAAMQSVFDRSKGELGLIQLPANVSDALQYLGYTHSPRDILALILQGSPAKPYKSYDRRRDEAIRALQVHEFDDILIALADGYEVEQSPEERLNNEIEEIILDWHEASSGEVPVLTKRIVDHLKSIQT